MKEKNLLILVAQTFSGIVRQKGYLYRKNITKYKYTNLTKYKYTNLTKNK